MSEVENQSNSCFRLNSQQEENVYNSAFFSALSGTAGTSSYEQRQELVVDSARSIAELAVLNFRTRVVSTFHRL